MEDATRSNKYKKIGIIHNKHGFKGMLKISIDKKPKGKFIFVEIDRNFIPFTINKISSNNNR